MAIDPGLRRLALGTLLAAFPGDRGRRTGPSTWSPRGWPGTRCSATTSSTPDQVAALTAGAARRPAPDVLIAIDEEGGDVTRLAHRHRQPVPGQRRARRGRRPGAHPPGLRRHRRRTGRARASTSTWRPTVDVNTADDNPIIGTRSFGADPRRVAAHAAAAVTGLQGAGVAACAKHFPGHGATTEDTVGRHDTLAGNCSREINMVRYGATASLSCRDNFIKALGELGMGPRDIPANINFFMNVPVSADGQVAIAEGISKPGDYVDLRCERDVIVVISNCPQEHNPCSGGKPTPIQLTIWRPH